MAQSHWSPANRQNGLVRRNSKPLPVAFHPQHVCSCHQCHKCVRAPTAPLGLPLPAPAWSLGIAPSAAFPCVLPLLPRTARPLAVCMGRGATGTWLEQTLPRLGRDQRLKVPLQCHILGSGRSWGQWECLLACPMGGIKSKTGGCSVLPLLPAPGIRRLSVFERRHVFFLE